jgi:hypothetical protein
MDAQRFDRLARALTAAGSRRGLLRLLAMLPILGGLVALLDLDAAEGKGRRRRRKKAHKHGKGRRRTHHKHNCKPNSLAKSCAGKCGLVKNTCKKTVDCGSCPAGATCCGNGCADLQIDPTHCGDCLTACSGTTPICEAGSCVPCSAPRTCPVGGCCADDGSCQGCGG